MIIREELIAATFGVCMWIGAVEGSHRARENSLAVLLGAPSPGTRGGTIDQAGQPVIDVVPDTPSPHRDHKRDRSERRSTSPVKMGRCDRSSSRLRDRSVSSYMKLNVCVSAFLNISVVHS